MYLAKAAINLAIREIANDQTPNYDGLKDNWADNEDVFKKITCNGEPDEFAAIGYDIEKGGQIETVFGLVDEERKININTAPKDLLIELLSKIGAANPIDIANNICAWRVDDDVSAPDYGDLGYVNKGAKFRNIAELIMVKDIDEATYIKLKDLITVWGNGKININTASVKILEILVEYCKKKTGKEPQDLTERIQALREAGIFFVSPDDLKTKLGTPSPLSQDQAKIIEEASNMAVFKSSCFCSIANGTIKNHIFFSLQCIYNRDQNKIVYWHES